MGVFVVVGGGLFADGQSRWSLTDLGVRNRPPFLFVGRDVCQYRWE